jgi:hypothetical protein
MPNETQAMPEGSTMTPSQVRKLKIAIAIMSVLLVAGFILLLVGIYMQTQKLDKKSRAGKDLPVSASSEGPAIINMPIKPGAELRQILTSNGNLILHLHHATGNEIIIADLATGQEIRRIQLTNKESP